MEIAPISAARDSPVLDQRLADLAVANRVTIYHLLREDGEDSYPVDADFLIGRAPRPRRSGSLVAIVTDRPIRVRGLQSAFGYSNRHLGVAVVSTALLSDSCDQSLGPKRLCNVVAHEIGHLRGFHHCRDPLCVMNPASEPTDLDLRPLLPCSCCHTRGPVSRRILGIVAALLFLLTSVVAVDRVISSIASTGPDFPFL